MKPPASPQVRNPLSTRYSLLGRLQNWEDAKSWKDFVETYSCLIYSVAAKSGLAEAEVQDVVQETVISVAKSIHHFECDAKLGSFRGWLRNITRRRVIDQLRKRIPAERADKRTTLRDVADSVSSKLEFAWDEEWRSHIVQAAAVQLKQKVRAEHYQIFHLHVLRDVPAPQVAKKLGVSVRQVYLIKHRLSVMFKKEVRHLEQSSP